VVRELDSGGEKLPQRDICRCSVITGGYVCDAGTWGVEEAEVICKQLGFSRGVQKTTQGLVHGKVEEGLQATERVVCSGRELYLEECDIEGMGEGGSCKLEEDIVSISCIPDSWATCEVSWKTGMDAPPCPAPQ